MSNAEYQKFQEEFLPYRRFLSRSPLVFHPAQDRMATEREDEVRERARRILPVEGAAPAVPLLVLLMLTSGSIIVGSSSLPEDPQLWEYFPFVAAAVSAAALLYFLHSWLLRPRLWAARAYNDPEYLSDLWDFCDSVISLPDDHGISADEITTEFAKRFAPKYAEIRNKVEATTDPVERARLLTETYNEMAKGLKMADGLRAAGVLGRDQYRIS